MAHLHYDLVALSCLTYSSSAPLQSAHWSSFFKQIYNTLLNNNKNGLIYLLPLSIIVAQKLHVLISVAEPEPVEPHHFAEAGARPKNSGSGAENVNS
jgi:hypothetical protein